LDLVFDLAKYEQQVCLQILHTYSSKKISYQELDEKERRNASLGDESNTLNDSRDHSRSYKISFEKLYKSSKLMAEPRGE
jgi:hypothetical protein